MKLRKRRDPRLLNRREEREGEMATVRGYANEKAGKVRCKYGLDDYRIAEYDFCFATALAYKASTCRSALCKQHSRMTRE